MTRATDVFYLDLHSRNTTARGQGYTIHSYRYNQIYKICNTVVHTAVIRTRARRSAKGRKASLDKAAVLAPGGPGIEAEVAAVVATLAGARTGEGICGASAGEGGNEEEEKMAEVMRKVLGIVVEALICAVASLARSVIV